MATYTENFNLEKPAQNEAVDVDVLNSNSDIIDDNLGQARQLALNIGYGYNNSVPYFVGDYCVYQNKLYKCIQNILTPENFDETKWQQCTLGGELQNIKGNTDDNVTDVLVKLKIGEKVYKICDFANENIANEYSASSTYEVGDYVIYEDDLYKCITAVSTAEPFDSNKWAECLVTDELGSGGGISMTVLSYGNSTWDDFISAYTSNTIVYCRASSNSDPSSGAQTRMAFMAYVNNEANPTEVEFQYYRSVSSHTAAQQGDQVFVYKLNKTTGWSVTTRQTFTKIVAGNNMTSSYSNGILTLNATGSGGSGGHTILDNDGTALTQRDEMQFVGTYSEDDSTNEITKVNIVREMTKAEFDLLSDDEKTGIIVTTDEETYSGQYGETILLSTPTSLGSGTSITLSDDYTNYDAIYIDFEPVDSALSVYRNCLVRLTSDISLNTTYVGYSVYDNGNFGFIYKLTNSNTFYGEAISPSSRDMKINKIVGIKFGGASSGSDEIYSTDERAVGTWIDGSTIYQKTVEFTSELTVNSNSWIDTSISNSGMRFISNAIGYWHSNGGGACYTICATCDTGNYVKILQTRNVDISLSGITIQYTKSTT